VVVHAVHAIVNEVKDLALRQEDKPQTHNPQRKIVQRISIALGSVNIIIKNNLQLTSLKKSKVQLLTGANKLSLINGKPI